MIYELCQFIKIKQGRIFKREEIPPSEDPWAEVQRRAQGVGCGPGGFPPAAWAARGGAGPEQAVHRAGRGGACESGGGASYLVASESEPEVSATRKQGPLGTPSHGVQTLLSPGVDCRSGPRGCSCE